MKLVSPAVVFVIHVKLHLLQLVSWLVLSNPSVTKEVNSFLRSTKDLVSCPLIY